MAGTRASRDGLNGRGFGMGSWTSGSAFGFVFLGDLQVRVAGSHGPALHSETSCPPGWGCDMARWDGAASSPEWESSNGERLHFLPDSGR